jgi:hypothetical protein
MFDSIDFKDCEILHQEIDCSQKEDLLQLKCGNGRLIDVGWYGSKNGYCVYVVENGDWEHPCYKFERQPRLEYIEHHLQMVIDFETAAFAAPEQELLGQITDILDNRTACKVAIDDIAKLLEQLRDVGLSQNEAENYIRVYAMRYRDTDEERWDIACDILDIIHLLRQ